MFIIDVSMLQAADSERPDDSSVVYSLLTEQETTQLHSLLKSCC